MLKGLFGPKTPKVPVSKLPQLHSFVDVSVAGKPAVSVAVESNGPKNIITTSPGATSGPAIFTYSNSTGKYRFGTHIVGTKGDFAVYEMPRKVDELNSMGGAQKRTSVRMDAIVPGMWRRAKNGIGAGIFAKTNVRDISRGGCSLILDHSVEPGTQVEVQLTFKAGSSSVTALGEVMRVELIKTSGKWCHGVRFQGIAPSDDHAIMEFINRRQSELRSRGLA